MEGGKVIKIVGDLFFFFSLFKTFFFFFHFSKRLKFVLGLPKWGFSTEKIAFHARKKIRKNNFAPSEKYACYAPCQFCQTLGY